MKMNRYFAILLILVLIASALAKNNKQSLSDIELPNSFPKGKYTPFGYIDNPYHSMVYNRSGVIRSVPPLGFGFWKKSFSGSYGEGTRGHVNYLSLLQIGLKLDNNFLFNSQDFKNHNIEIYSKYHSKHMMSYDFSYEELNCSIKYFLPSENTLACMFEIENIGEDVKDISLSATNVYGLWEISWWGSDGLNAKYDEEHSASISKIWAYGDVVVLGSDFDVSHFNATDSEKKLKKLIINEEDSEDDVLIVRGLGPIYNFQSYNVSISAKSKISKMIYLCRGKTETEALNELRNAKKTAFNELYKQLQADEEFWSTCPKLSGDWPDNWKHGWVYDYETLRMNIRNPIGIFNYPWDAMQVHSPRLVLGETALDMFAMHFANPELAKKVIYGTFADALAPNVPCAREDGSINMIGADGSECGTAPMWGFPFHVIQSIYKVTNDKQWITDLYPYLKAYLEWWLENRTDEEGWLHCNNSWESGQDDSKRFLVEMANPADFVRTVDVEASMAEAMQIMVEFAAVAEKEEDRTYWEKLAKQRIENTRSMFYDDQYRDIDGRTNRPIILDTFNDAMMLSPFTCAIATPEQIEKMRPVFNRFVNNPKTLEWPPDVFTFTEAALVSGEAWAAAEAVKIIADRIYTRTNSRSLFFVDKKKKYTYRIPGIANEFWPVDLKPAGGENYGWGAILPALIIRNIIGYREVSNSDECALYLSPQIPKDYYKKGKTFGIEDLHFRDITFDVSYQIKDKNEMDINLEFRSAIPYQVTIISTMNNEVVGKYIIMKKITFS
ncbi:hypothetical protein KJ656_06790, partial [bacterium]|nr:hypothetical protein [bacterium]